MWSLYLTACNQHSCDTSYSYCSFDRAPRTDSRVRYWYSTLSTTGLVCNNDINRFFKLLDLMPMAYLLHTRSELEVTSNWQKYQIISSNESIRSRKLSPQGYTKIQDLSKFKGFHGQKWGMELLRSDLTADDVIILAVKMEKFVRFEHLRVLVQTVHGRKRKKSQEGLMAIKVYLTFRLSIQ